MCTGIHTFDTCGRFRVAVAQLGEFLPALKGVNNTFFIPSAMKVGLLDDAGLSDNPEVQSALNKLQFPVIKLDPEIFVMSAEQKAKVMMLFTTFYSGTHFLIKNGTAFLAVSGSGFDPGSVLGNSFCSYLIAPGSVQPLTEMSTKESH